MASIVCTTLVHNYMHESRLVFILGLTHVLYCIVLYCIVLNCIALHCIALHCIALHCIALHCIVRPYTEGRLDRRRIGIHRVLSKFRTRPWLSEGSLTCDPYHHRGPIF